MYFCISLYFRCPYTLTKIPTEMKLKVDEGKKLLCFSGAGIASAAEKASTEFNRESHSVLGSFFLNPTCSAGVAFGSGGTNIRKGPAFTERALYAKVCPDGKTVTLVNTLAIEGLEDFSEISEPHAISDFLSKLQVLLSQPGDSGSNSINKIMGIESKVDAPPASDTSYKVKVCDTNSNGISRYNADTSGLEVNRSEGKLLILATVHDTFEKPKSTETYWISFPDLESALKFRKSVALDNPKDLPISMEYLDRDSFDIIDQAGRILASVIQFFGAGHKIVGELWSVKSFIESLHFLPKSEIICDWLLYVLNNVFPESLPKRLMYLGRSQDHHIMLTIGDYSSDENETGGLEEKGSNNSLTRLQSRLETYMKENPLVTVHKCTSSKEVEAMQAFRFVAATAFRTWCVGNDTQGISVDYALPLNSGYAPPLIKNTGGKNDDDSGDEVVEPVKRMRYSHFGCNVVHEDLAYARGVDVEAQKMKLKKIVEKSCGGKLPAEHGHGTEYKGTKEAKERWMKIDPSNSMNPGIGGLSHAKNYE